MRVFVPQLNKEGHGGGNTFVENFQKFTEFELTDVPVGSEVMFVANPMWAERKDFDYAQRAGIKIVLRVDNIPEDWNNRGTAISKLKDFLVMADAVIYQSYWAGEKYGEFIKANDLKVTSNRRIIHNGVDIDLFSPDGIKLDQFPGTKILFVKSSRNENKRWPEAMEVFRRYYASNNNSKLYLVGQFSEDTYKYNFGFYNNENYEYLGVLDRQTLARVYRTMDVLFFPAYADCAPNTVLESLSCGIPVLIHPYGGGVEFLGFSGGRHCIIDTVPYASLTMIRDALRVDKQVIRDHIVKCFSARDMVDKYEEVLNGV